MGASGQNPLLRAFIQARQRLPHHAGHRQFRHGGEVLDGFHFIDNEAEPVAHVDEARVDGRTVIALEHNAGRIALAADSQRMHLQARLVFRDGGADFQHVGAQHHFISRFEVIGVVFHKGGSLAGRTCHQLGEADHGGRLPVSLATESIPCGHETLHGQTGQLIQSVQIFECGRERAISTLFQECFHGNFVTGLHTDGVPGRTGHLCRFREIVRLLVFRHQGIHLGFCDRLGTGNQIPDAIAVHSPAEPDLRLHLVSLGDGHIAHVVAKAGHLELAGFHIADRGTHPGANLRQHALILPEAHHNLARDAHAGANETVLAIAMGGLVQVHEIHVDFIPRNIAVVLRVQVQQRLAQQGKAGNPHLGRRERVHPGDDAGTFRVRVGRFADGRDFCRCFHNGLENNAAGDVGVRVHALGNFLGMRRHLIERFRTIEVLAAGDEPDVVLVEFWKVFHVCILRLLNLGCDGYRLFFVVEGFHCVNGWPFASGASRLPALHRRTLLSAAPRPFPVARVLMRTVEW